MKRCPSSAAGFHAQKSPPLAIAATAIAALLGAGGCGRAAAEPPAAAPASSAFWSTWGDGRAEISGYRLVTPRYGAPRDGEMVLIYVTEDLDRRTWIKDDRGDLPAPFRIHALKLNQVLKFRTGIYPYSVMTSVFVPVDGDGRERFSPGKISLGAQEWCGHVFHAIWPEEGRMRSEEHSYFQSEGDRSESLDLPAGTLFEDALLIQLRELDGPFAGGGDWSGQIVPSLWAARKAHQPLRPAAATIRRAAAARDGVPVTRFTLAYGGTTRTIDVERAEPRRILGWTGSDGEAATVLKTARLPYWELNAPGGEKYLSEIGLADAMR